MLQPWESPAPERTGKPSAYALLPEDFERMGAPGRGEHIFGTLQRPWAYVDGQPRLSRQIRAWLTEYTDLSLPKIQDTHPSEDGSTKLALRLEDGECVEAVHMPREVRNPRVTLCISSQVGCAMGCRFCATGALGIHRNLTAGEIVGQVITLLQALGPEVPHAITLVFMGMGEPLHNLDHVHRAIQIFNQERGLNISTRRITVSTSGLVPGIEKLARLQPRPWLALSLNATTDEARSKVMPVNKVWNLARLREALGAWPLHRGEKLTIEYVLMDGINDTAEDAARLAAWLGDLRLHHNVNLIRMNEHEGTGIKEPQEDRVSTFVTQLKSLGCFVTVRKSRGRDVQGACGQLAKTRTSLSPD